MYTGSYFPADPVTLAMAVKLTGANSMTVRVILNSSLLVLLFVVIILFK